MFFRDCRHVAALILPDLCFEWILSICMVFSLGAIFAPLFILLGLQEGIVGNMIDQLKRSPESRLVTPRYPLKTSLDDDWLAALGRQAETVITSPASHLLLDIEGLGDPVNAIPTTPEDPLLAENGISLAGGNERSVVLSAGLSRHTGKKRGDFFTVILVRYIGGRKEQAPIQFRVAGVLPETASPDAKFWIPRDLFRWFDQWRKGRAVPELGLSGTGTFLRPEFDGILTLLKKIPPDEDYRRMLSGRTSFSRLPQPCEDAGWQLPPESRAHLWKPVNSRIYKSDFKPLENRHHELGYAVETIPFLENFKVELSSEGRDKKMTVTILPDSPPGNESDKTPHVMCSDEDGFRTGATGQISFSSGSEKKRIVIPVNILSSSKIKPGRLAVPDKQLAGKMNAARRQTATYDPVSGEFSPVGEEMRYFRAYAKSIDGLETLVEFIRQEGIKQGSGALREPNSRLEEVRSIRRLAFYMEQLYILIVVVSGVSGIFAIAASVYAGVQRKRKDLAYLELLGVHRGALFLFPYLKSLMLVAGGVISAFIAYLIFGHFSDKLFVHVLGEAASLTRLTGWNIFYLIAGIFTAGSLASLLAATSVMRIEPGEYIRE